jgi:lipoprotein NlpD
VRGALLASSRSGLAPVALGGFLCLLPGTGIRAQPAQSGAGKAAAIRHVPQAGVTYTVRAGDTAWSVARRHGVTVAALRQANDLGPGDSIQVGQRLTIPGRPVVPARQEPPSMAEIVLEAPAGRARVALAWPVKGPILSPFGPRGDGWHGGIDLAAERGTPIRAAASGMVITSAWERGYGHVVKIWHTDDLMTVYAHNRENHVRVGDWVNRGQVIAVVGATGRATAPHLHFEVRLGGKKYDPRYWLPAADGVEVAASGTGGPSRLR